MSTPQLHYFRAVPRDWANCPPLASSFQSFETMLFMLALHRHPAAVIACQSAIESALKAHLRAKPRAQINVASSVTALANQAYRRLGEFPAPRILDLTNLRNDFIHFGFNPEDDRRAITQILKTGLPLLLAIYADLFDIFLDARAIRPDLRDITSLTTSERDRVALVPEFGDQVRHALDVFALVKDQPHIDPTYCIHALAYLVGRSVTANFMSSAERDLAFGDKRADRAFEIEEGKRCRLEGIFSESWRFNCPICAEGASGFVCEVVEESDSRHGYSVRRGACPSCGFSISPDHHHLADVLLAAQLPAAVIAISSRQ